MDLSFHDGSPRYETAELMPDDPDPSIVTLRASPEIKGMMIGGTAGHYHVWQFAVESETIAWHYTFKG